MQPVVFLDFDGVICTVGAYVASGRTDWADADCCARVLNLVERFGLKIVVSSTWRMMWPRAELLMLNRGLLPHLHPTARATGVAKRVSPGGIVLADVRGREIEDWLIENGHRPYIILDDDSDMLPHQMPNYVACPVDTGFGAEQYRDASRKLVRQGVQPQ